MALKLTPRQQEILDFIRSTLELLGAPPTRAEICNAFGFASPNAAEEHLKALAKKGAIVLEPGSARGIRLVEQLGLPLIGSVAAGSPLLAVENQLGRIQLKPLARSRFSSGWARCAACCCGVSGDSVGGAISRRKRSLLSSSSCSRSGGARWSQNWRSECCG